MLNVNDKVLVRNNFGGEFEGTVKEINGNKVTIDMKIHDRKDKSDTPYIYTCVFSMKSSKCSHYDSSSVQHSMYIAG